jgi:arylformamidase
MQTPLNFSFHHYYDIGIIVDATIGEEQVQTFSLPNAEIQPICSTKNGSSVNVYTLSVTAHSNGTHTEGVGHISLEGTAIMKHPPPPFLKARLVTIRPEKFEERKEETYDFENHDHKEDIIISKYLLQKTLQKKEPHQSQIINHSNNEVEEEKNRVQNMPKLFFDDDWFEALIVRTIPNNEGAKKTANYSSKCEKNVAYFTNEAMEELINQHPNCKHLLVDLPSVDRKDDGGYLAAHSLFFGLPKRRASNNYKAESECLQKEERKGTTITELCYIDDVIPDGDYLLNLQLAPLEGVDAVPSRPLIFPITN